MFFPEDRVRIFVHERPVDMRKSFDGLYALVKHVLGEDPLSGSVYVFVNRRGNYLKALYFDRTGFCIWAKRLEHGVFVRRHSGTLKREMRYMDLKLMLEGIDLDEVRRRKRFSLKPATHEHFDHNASHPSASSI